jgi:hypothetical protein
MAPAPKPAIVENQSKKLDQKTDQKPDQKPAPKMVDDEAAIKTIKELLGKRKNFY